MRCCKINFNKKHGWFLLPCFIFIMAAIALHDLSTFARDFEVEGAVVDIQWKSPSNRTQKVITIEALSGGTVEIAHTSFRLCKSDIKVGDKFIKKRGLNHCIINGKKVRCVRDVLDEMLSEEARLEARCLE